MDVPPIRYALSEDGTRIAYWVYGSGDSTPILLTTINPISIPLTACFAVPEWVAWLDQMAAGRTVIGYDSRGLGMSRSQVTDMSLDTLAQDLQAVVQAVGVGPVAVWADWTSGFLGVRAARAYPEHVSHLVLWHASPGLRQGETSPAVAVSSLMNQDYATYARTAAALGADWSDEDVVERWAEVMLKATPAGTARHLAELRGDFVHVGVRDELAAVTCPTLVLSRAEVSSVPIDRAQELAAGIAGAELKILSGKGGFAFLGDVEAVVSATHDFIDRRDNAGTPGRSGGFQTILFTDLEASTPLTQRLGDEGAQEILRGHNDSVRTALRDHGGREVKHTGDGIMASFPSAVAAVTAALQIQRELAGGEVRVRVGLNAGEPIAEDDDLFGLSVIKAARVADHAEPGQVLVSRVVRELCEGKTFQFTSLGAVQLKGFDEAVELFEVSV